MTDLETAVQHLEGHSICLCRDGHILTDTAKGIAPLMHYMRAGTVLKGYSCADLVIGKAAAVLMIKLELKAVYGKVMSQSAVSLLEQYRVPYAFETLTDTIMNRQGNDICPMEKAVSGTDSIDEACAALLQAVRSLNSKPL